MDTFLGSLLVALLGCVIAAYVFFAKAFVCQTKLFRYLKAEHYEQWRHLRSFGNGKYVGGVNFERTRAYLKSSDGEEDLKVLRFKDELRFCLRVIKVMILTMVVDIAFVFVYTVF